MKSDFHTENKKSCLGSKLNFVFFTCLPHFTLGLTISVDIRKVKQFYVVISLKCYKKCKFATCFLWLWILCYGFWGSEGFQGTHMDVLNHFSSKLMTNPKKRFVNLFGEFSPFCAAAAAETRRDASQYNAHAAWHGVKFFSCYRLSLNQTMHL